MNDDCLFRRRGVDIEHRIDIHTQTLAGRTAASAMTATTGALGIPGYPGARKSSFQEMRSPSRYDEDDDEVGPDDDDELMMDHDDDYDEEEEEYHGRRRRHHNPPRQREREDRRHEEDEAAAAAAGDMDWKTHSLPSLGRISSDNTLESSGADDCYTVQASSTKNRKNWRNNKQVFTGLFS